MEKGTLKLRVTIHFFALVGIVVIFDIILIGTLQALSGLFHSSIQTSAYTSALFDKYVYFLTITCIVVSLLILFIAGAEISFLRNLQNVLNKLKEAASQMAKGNLDIRINTDSLELHEITQSFNEMGERLRTFYMKIQEENARSDIIFESIGEGMVVVDQNGNVLMMNHRAKMMLGLYDAILGRKFVDLVPAEYESGEIVGVNERPIIKALLTHEKISSSMNSGVLYYIKRDGSRLPVEITSTALFFQGKLGGAIELFHDITHERDIDRMKTEFISLASHQLRTPLSAIKWFSDMLLAGDAGEMNSEQKEFTQNISLSTDRMIELVNSLLNISRIESGRIVVDPKPTDLKKLVEDIVSELQVKIQERRQHLVISVHGDLPLIVIDPRLIRQVYMNLLTNAIKYTPKDGEIMVLISKKDNEVISQVSDNGFGIPHKDQNKVFQKFFRADNVIKVETDGSGLGLYLIKAIIESSNGKIWFKSEEGKGTTFWFSLPLGGVAPHRGEVTLDN